jgi:hypothetical protein
MKLAGNLRLPRPLSDSEFEHLTNVVSSVFRGVKPMLYRTDITLRVEVLDGCNSELEMRCMEFIKGYLSGVFRNDF